MNATVFNYSSDEGQNVLASLYPDMPEARRKLFGHECDRTQLDPVARQIYSVMRKNYGKDTWATQVSIDGFRLIAQRSQEYAGQAGPFWCGKDGKWTDIWTSNDYPFAAKVGVYRKGFIEPLWAIAKWDSYVGLKDGKANKMWEQFAETMIAKCAEALALRRAFPAELSGLYSTEEMDQATKEAAKETGGPSDKDLETKLMQSVQAGQKATIEALNVGLNSRSEGGVDEGGASPIDRVAEASYGQKGEGALSGCAKHAPDFDFECYECKHGKPAPTAVTAAPAKTDPREGLDQNQDAGLAIMRANVEECKTPEELTVVGNRILKLKDVAVKTLAQAAFKAFRESKGWITERQADGTIVVVAGK